MNVNSVLICKLISNVHSILKNRSHYQCKIELYQFCIRELEIWFLPEVWQRFTDIELSLGWKDFSHWHPWMVLNIWSSSWWTMKLCYHGGSDDSYHGGLWQVPRDSAKRKRRVFEKQNISGHHSKKVSFLGVTDIETEQLFERRLFVSEKITPDKKRTFYGAIATLTFQWKLQLVFREWCVVTKRLFFCVDVSLLVGC